MRTPSLMQADRSCRPPDRGAFRWHRAGARKASAGGLFVLVAFLALSPCGAADDVQFTRDVLPILASNCFACHGFDEGTREAGLRLDTFDGATAELDSGARAIVPGDAAESELLRRVETGDAGEIMPPADSGKELSPQQKRILRQWVEQGAEYRPHWSFVAPRQVPPPEVPGVEHPIDRFIQSRLADPQLKLRPSAEAPRETLIRRVSLDLTGLPPTPREVDEFLVASARDPEVAYRTLVERLLSSPHYGERWARWWLDQARYADSNGYSIDAPRQIWKYRDWVVTALNADMPFDQFTVEQLAGDLLPDATDAQRVATGFHRNTQINQEGGIDKEQFRVDSVFDRVATTGTVWLGLTVGCAQCHNHKFDPIEQKEYYRLFAFLNNQEEPTMRVYEPDVDVPQLMSGWRAAQSDLKKLLEEHAQDLAAWEASLDEAARKQLGAGVQKILAVAAGKRSLDQQRALYRAAPGFNDSTFQEVERRYADLERRVNGATTTMVLQELANPRKTTVFIKGDFTRPADEVNPGTPAVLHPFENTTGQANRLDLARWITSRRNPLTARVVVNRIWQQYFGRGIVETENDFGLQGTPPTHPELLDWLAVEWMARGWSLKELHRLVVTSHTYRQSSSDRPDIREKDPNNYFLARQQRLRLEAEIIRDVALTASGLLAPKLGGPPVYPPIPDGVMGQGQVKREWAVSQGPDRYRRGLYTFVYRATPPPALNVFDAPDGYSTCTRRIRSNTPLQALTLLNDAAYFEFAEALEKIIERDGLEAAFRRCTARRPDERERELLSQLDTLSAARVLLNLDETVTRE